MRARPSQDLRDAIAAAVTARLYDDRATERYGEIVVPADASAVTRLRAASGR